MAHPADHITDPMTDKHKIAISEKCWWTPCQNEDKAVNMTSFTLYCKNILCRSITESALESELNGSSFNTKIIFQGKRISIINMMTSSNRNIFCVTGPLCGEFTGHRWITLTKASDSELWCFLWSAPWINGWVYNHEAGDLRHHRAHYDIIVMKTIWSWDHHCFIMEILIPLRCHFYI